MMYAKQVIVWGSLLVLTGCMNVSQPPVHMHIEASKQLNQDTHRVSLPVRIKIFQLADSTLFNEATFHQLWKSDVTVLGTTLLAKKVITINPGEQLNLKLFRQDQAKYIGVVGIFRQYHHNGWKDLRPLPNQLSSIFQPVFIKVKDRTVEIDS